MAEVSQFPPLSEDGDVILEAIQYHDFRRIFSESYQANSKAPLPPSLQPSSPSLPPAHLKIHEQELFESRYRTLSPQLVCEVLQALPDRLGEIRNGELDLCLSAMHPQLALFRRELVGRLKSLEKILLPPYSVTGTGNDYIDSFLEYFNGFSYPLSAIRRQLEPEAQCPDTWPTLAENLRKGIEQTYQCARRLGSELFRISNKPSVWGRLQDQMLQLIGLLKVALDTLDEMEILAVTASKGRFGALRRLHRLTSL
jgi:hypothetical protein